MFSIRLNSGVPIYRQVVDQVVYQIDHGKLKVGELLPSVRQLANELGVNPMTVSRAYSLLESEAVVERKRGVGMVVIRAPQNATRVLSPSVQQVISDAKQLGLAEQDLIELIRKHWKKKGK